MNDFYAFLTTQALVFLAPVGLAWFITISLRCRPPIGRNILIGAMLGIYSSTVAFVAFWPMIFPKREAPVPVDGQSGLGQALVIFALIAFSYLVAGLFFVNRTVYSRSASPPPLP